MNEEKREQKTVCIVATNGKSLTNFRGKLIQSWKELGFRVCCISIEPYSEMQKDIELLGTDYIQVIGTRTGIGLFSELKMIGGYKKAFKKVRADYAFLYMSKPVAYGGPAAVLAKVPHINVLVNGLENAYYRTGIKDAIVRLVMSSTYRFMGKRAEHTFFQNSDDYGFFKKHGLLVEGKSVIVNGSGVDMDHFLRKPLPSKPVFLMVARLLWSKGIREFLEAVTVLKEKHPEAEILIVGGLDENDEALTKEELDEAIRTNQIEYCGYTDDVRPYLERCSVYVLPSYHEGTPRSVLEAMASGRAVITTDAPGCKETVQDGKNGFLVPVRDSKLLAEKMILLAENPDLRQKMGDCSYELCKQKYDVNKVNSEINQIMFGGKQE